VRVIVQVSRLGVHVGSDAELDAARTCFARNHCVLLREFVSPDLFAALRRSLAAAPFTQFVHGEVGDHVTELVMSDPALLGRLQFLFNDRRVFEVVEQVTGRTGIECFAARVYQMVPGQDHHDDWHDDLEEDASDTQRLAAMSINLSRDIYQGGVLEIMDRDQQRLVCEVANTGPGDAILFELSERLKHRVTDVTGPAAKMALAGWFQTAPVYRSLVRAAAGVPPAR
jgi:hypothetical protein